MPIRMLRDWTDSEKVNNLTVQAERFFTRLIMKVDDYGCFYADTRLLKANLFPLLLDSVREADISRWTAECRKAGLIVLYESANKKYLQIIDFKQRLDKAKAKYPLPTSTDSLTENIEFPSEIETERKPKTETEREAAVSASIPAIVFSDEEKNLFKNFEEWIRINAPRVASMKEPFTIAQYVSLKKKNYDYSEIKQLLADMHNWADLHKKRVSAYLTLIKWKRREEK